MQSNLFLSNLCSIYNKLYREHRLLLAQVSQRGDNYYLAVSVAEALDKIQESISCIINEHPELISRSINRILYYKPIRETDKASYSFDLLLKGVELPFD